MSKTNRRSAEDTAIREEQCLQSIYGRNINTYLYQECHQILLTCNVKSDTEKMFLPDIQV